jgi:hypothetical protein
MVIIAPSRERFKSIVGLSLAIYNMRREFFGLSSRSNRIDSLVPARADQVIE